MLCSFYCIGIRDGVLDDFPKISDHCPKVSEECPKLLRRPDESSRTFSENFQRLPKTFEEDSKMFRWYTNEFKYNLRDKLDINEIIDIFTCEDIISSYVRISYHFYQFVTTRYTTDFYIIKVLSAYLSKLGRKISPKRERQNLTDSSGSIPTEKSLSNCFTKFPGLLCCSVYFSTRKSQQAWKGNEFVLPLVDPFIRCFSICVILVRELEKNGSKGTEIDR